MSRLRRAHQSHRDARALIFLFPIAVVALGALVLVLVISAGTLLSYGQDLPKLRKGDLPRADETTKIYAANGTLLASLYAEQNRVALPLRKIPLRVQKAVVDIEDERFWTHDGVDFRAVARAIRVNMQSGRVLEGGSTIDQQYVRNILVTREKTIKRKIREALLAYQLEKVLSKREILERYLNTVYFGASAYGVEAAAATYFGKHASGLTLPEAALLAGLIRSPNRLSPHVDPVAARRRRDVVLNKMYDLGHITNAQLAAALKRPIRVRPALPPSTRAPYFTEYVKQLLIDKYGAGVVFRGGLRVRTTIDLRMQRAAERAWRSILGKRSDPSVAIVAIDPRTGYIRAMVGGRKFAESKYNLAVQAHRQPGSAFKPFVLAAALEDGVSPMKKYESAPALIQLPGGGTWNVDNATEGSGGDPMTLRDGTIHSVNGVFARLVMDIGADKVASTARKLGIMTRLETNPAIALGGMRRGVTPLEMASAFGSFARGGLYREPIAITRIADTSGRVIGPGQPISTMGIGAGTAYVVTDILQDVINEGTGVEADIGRPAAGKTGTTQSYRDAWFVGYVPTLVASVWVGYPKQERPMTDVRGISVKGGTFPAMIWARFMRSALARTSKATFLKPTGKFLKIRVCVESGLLATKYCPETVMSEFVRGTQPTRTCTLHRPPAKAPSVDVPNVVGFDVDAATARLAASGLQTRISTASDGRAGVVQWQDPRVGVRVARGSAVTLGVPGALHPSGSAPPVASFSVSPASPRAGQTSVLDAASSYDTDGDIAVYGWTFGDGAQSSGETVSHAFSRSGRFTITLTVWDQAGHSSSKSRAVTVR